MINYLFYKWSFNLFHASCRFCCCCWCCCCYAHNEQHNLLKFNGTSRWHFEQSRITNTLNTDAIALLNEWVLRPSSNLWDAEMEFLVSGFSFQWSKWIISECFSIILNSKCKRLNRVNIEESRRIATKWDYEKSKPLRTEKEKLKTKNKIIKLPYAIGCQIK